MKKEILPYKGMLSLKEVMAHVPWESEKTIRRRIKDDRFPNYKYKNTYYFDLKEVELWFKRRMVQKAG
jgi:predicted DNA-binding transcriptional regulator AlpA